MSPPSVAWAAGFLSLLCSSTSFIASPAVNSSFTLKRTRDWKFASVCEGVSWIGDVVDTLAVEKDRAAVTQTRHIRVPASHRRADVATGGA